MREILAIELPDQRAVTALTDVEHRIVCEVVHESHTSRAQDAAVGDVDDVAAEILSRIEALGLSIPRVLAAFLVGVVLELTFTGLIADRTVEWVIDQEHLEHALACFE
jgi:hypothetical protein